MADPLRQPTAGGDQDRGPTLLAVYWTECAVALSVITLRLLARLMIKKLGVDDWVMFFTMFLFVILCSLTTVMVGHGGARHIYYLTPSQLSNAVKFNWMAQAFGITIVGTGKISTALLMLKIMGPSLWRKWFLYISVVLTLIFTILAALFAFVQCDPPRALWEKVPGAKCWDPKINTDWSIFTACWNSFFDLALALLPITIVWNLQMKLQKKVALCSMLGLGVFASISSAIKTSKLSSLNARSDLTWATYDLYVWASAEMFIILVLGSVPTLKPLYDRLTKMPQSYPSKYLLQRKDVEYSSNGSPVRPGTSAYSRPRYGHENLWDDGDTDNDTRLNSIKVHRSFDVHLDKNKKPRLQPKMEEIGRQPVVTRDVV